MVGAFEHPWNGCEQEIEVSVDDGGVGRENEHDRGAREQFQGA